MDSEKNENNVKTNKLKNWQFFSCKTHKIVINLKVGKYRKQKKTNDKQVSTKNVKHIHTNQ